MQNFAALKRQAREILSVAQVSPWTFGLVFVLLTQTLSWADTYVSGALVETLRQYAPEVPIPAILLHPDYPRNAVVFVAVLTRLLSAVLGAGMAMYHLGVRRGEVMPLGTLFDGFGLAGKVILLWLIEGALVALGLALFVLPGVVLNYRYRFALYCLLEDPALAPVEAMRRSARLTAGHKGELFLLDVTFLGWFLLSELTLGLASIYAVPYYTQTVVGAFRVLRPERETEGPSLPH